MEDMMRPSERAMADHPECVKRVIFRSQFQAIDTKRIHIDHPEYRKEWIETLPPYFSAAAVEEVEEDGVTYYEIGRVKADNISNVEIPGHMRIRKEKEIPVLYDKHGKEKKAGDPALGLAYDADGLVVPDWEVVDSTRDVNGKPVIDEKGRRRGCVQLQGILKPEEHYGIRNRSYPSWGKCYGIESRPNVGEIGKYTVADGKLCLTTEDFGWELGEDANKIDAPPLIRLVYAESHSECESIRIYTGLSEIHFDHKEDFEEVYAMLRGLGYITYHPPLHASDRYWGEDIDPNPFRVIDTNADKDLEITFYSWYFRLPPFMNNLWLEGELGDDEHGPDAKKLLEKKERYFASEREWASKRLAALRKRVHEQKSQSWYKEYFGKYAREENSDDDTNTEFEIPELPKKPITLVDYTI